MINYLKTRKMSFFKSVNLGWIIAAFAFLVCLLSAQNIQAQGVATYTFTPTSGTFTPLGGAAVITPVVADADDGRYAAVPIGFTFKYDGTNFTQVYAVTNGWMSFVPTTTFQFNNSLDGTFNSNRPFVAPLYDDLDMTDGSVSYLTAGTSPNRVFTMQYLNAKWDYQAAAPGISFQIKLYETTNQVQFIYRREAGALGMDPGSFGASIGLAGTATGSGRFLSLNNSSAAPTASSTTDTRDIGTKPATGQIYTFAPQVVTAASISITGRVMAPQNLGLTNALVTLTNSQGESRTILTRKGGSFRFSELTAGETYILTVASKRYTYAPQVVTAIEDLADVNFAPQSRVNYRW